MRMPLLAVALAALLGAAGCGGDGEPSTERVAVVWAVGDGGTGSEEAKQLAGRIADDDPARLLYLGDVYPDGTAEDYEKRYETVYGALAGVTEPTPGNHEWPNRAEGYNPYWQEAKGRVPRDAYAFELAGWQIIALNSEAPHGPDSEQVRYLRSQRARTGTCRLAFWHRPLYSGGEHGDEDVAPFWDALAGRAALVLNGHDHNTQRFAPRDGITQIIAGAGGANMYEVDPDEPGLEWFDDERRAALRLTLRAGRADYAVVAVDGKTLDEGRIDCEPLAPAP